jgi:hypothetical protein
MRWVLGLAAVYNIAWGAFTVFLPRLPWQWIGLAEPRYLFLWQCIGMIVGVYGVGYALAARRPYTHWPIVVVGLLGKVFGPIGFVYYVLTGGIDPAFGLAIAGNDLIWWAPFGAILWGAWRWHRQTGYTSEAIQQ